MFFFRLVFVCFVSTEFKSKLPGPEIELPISMPPKYAKLLPCVRHSNCEFNPCIGTEDSRLRLSGNKVNNKRVIQKELGMNNEKRTVDPRILRKVFSSKLPEGYENRQTPEEG